MKIKKILSLLLSTTFLNLSTNFINCFGMKPFDDYSVTEVKLDGFTNCNYCGATRSSKLNIRGNSYSSQCPGCGRRGFGLIKQTKRHIGYKIKTNEISACKFCGCQRKRCIKQIHTGNDLYRCNNCNRGGTKRSLCVPYTTQIWKKSFCNCESCSGLIVDFRTISNIKPGTNQIISKSEVIKSILRDPNGFEYYCYNCDKRKHINLEPETAEEICLEYEHTLNKYPDVQSSHKPLFPSFEDLEASLSTSKK